MKRLELLPGYLLTCVALFLGIIVGGVAPERLSPVASGTALFLRIVLQLVPILILVTLSPAVATLGRRGLAGRFAGAVILWIMATSACAGLFGAVISSLIFRIPPTGTQGSWSEVGKIISAFSQNAVPSLPLIAIGVAIVVGICGFRSARVYACLSSVEGMIATSGRKVGRAMTILIFFLGITIGVKFGTELGIGHYLEMTLYTALLCLGWFTIYLLIAVKFLAGWPLRRVLARYVVPTATVAAATCSSLITLPVNLAQAKEVGVRDEVADFVIPCGSVINHSASALMYVATAPFVIHHIFGLDISLTTMAIAWPAIVLFSMAAPGLPAGMGTALWGATLFASMLNLRDPARTDLVATWIALSAGLPDMARTAVSATSDGFTAIFFDSAFDRFFAPNRRQRAATAATARVSL